MSKPMSRAEMKDWANETWQKCLEEPVGKFAKFTDGVWREVTDGSPGAPLYAAPRQWVGLTDEEIKSLPSWWPSYEDAPALIELVKDVEAKLKEKNT
jgi:hypothetical protein